MFIEIPCKSAFPTPRFPLDQQHTGDAWFRPCIVLCVVPKPLKGALGCLYDFAKARVDEAKAGKTFYSILEQIQMRMDTRF